MPLLDAVTHKHQSNLASYCRTGQLVDIPGIKKENITHYRRLVYSVIVDMLEDAYPLTHKLLSPKEWKTAVNDFFTNHPCQSPQVWYMPKEFYQYLSELPHPLLKKYTFLKELLWFEWVEIELFMMEDIPVAYADSGDVSTSPLVINPEHQLLSFQYPVHQKSAQYITLTDKKNYFVIAHRNAHGEVIFTDSSPALIRMLEYLAKEPLSIKELFTRFQDEYDMSIQDKDQKHIISFFENAYQQQLIIGFKN